MVIRVVFESKIKGEFIVMPNNVVVPIDKFEEIFREAKDNPTYENMMEVNDLGIDEEGDLKERGYSKFLEQCKEEGILN